MESPEKSIKSTTTDLEKQVCFIKVKIMFSFFWEVEHCRWDTSVYLSRGIYAFPDAEVAHHPTDQKGQSQLPSHLAQLLNTSRYAQYPPPDNRRKWNGFASTIIFSFVSTTDFFQYFKKSFVQLSLELKCNSIFLTAPNVQIYQIFCLWAFLWLRKHSTKPHSYISTFGILQQNLHIGWRPGPRHGN